MENYLKKAADAFLVERPYGMRVDYRKKGFVLFNRKHSINSPFHSKNVILLL